MPSYMTFIVLAIAVSNVSTALAAPIQAVWEQSLSHRDPGQTSETQPLLHNTDAEPNKAVAPKTSTWKGTAGKLAGKFVLGTLSTMAGISLLRSITGGGSSSKTSTPSTSTTSSTYPNQATYYPSTPNTQPGYQRRAPDKGLPVDLFGEAYFESRFIKYVADCIATTAGPSEAEARSVSDNERHATSPVDLLNRADSGEVLRLLKRVLNELD